MIKVGRRCLGTKGREKKVDSRYADIGFLIISADNYQYDDPAIIQRLTNSAVVSIPLFLRII